ncbi:heterokaryon incompatibility protein-domain-containing protein [Phyllosticta citrichinensis]
MAFRMPFRPRLLRKQQFCFGIDDKVRLVELPPDSQVTYTTLSHCWGSEAAKPLRTLKTNIASMRESIDWDKIPRTFKDAITITRSLSLEYIWIDSLCIIQDDNDDWKEQSAQMATVYSNSYLNIAATASKNANGGLFASRVLAVNPPSGTDTRSVESHALSANVVARTHFHQAHKPFFRMNESDFENPHENPFPLLQRAWVFQERMLSRRTVHFTRSEMVWECREHTACECGDYDDPDLESEDSRRITKTLFSGLTGDEEMKTYDLQGVWEVSVATYSRLNISKPKDWPHAMAGLATRLVPHFKSNYIAGMWERSFPHCLMWKPATKDISIKSYHTSTREWPFHTYSFPSGPPTWSWLNCRAAIKSDDGEIKSALWAYTRSYEEADRDVKFEFGDAIDPAEDHQSAEFQVHHRGRLLYLTGLLQECHIRIPSPSSFPKVKFKLDGCEDNDAIDIWLDFKAPETLASAWYPFYCLRISKTDYGIQESLVLAAFPGENFYVRVGTGFSWRSEDPFKDAKVCRVEVR